MSLSTRNSNADFPDHIRNTVATPHTAADGGSTTRTGPAGGGGRTGWTPTPPQYRSGRVAALLAACMAALGRGMERYREGDGETPAADISGVLADLLVTRCVAWTSMAASMTTMLALGTLLAWDETEPDGDATIGTLSVPAHLFRQVRRRMPRKPKLIMVVGDRDAGGRGWRDEHGLAASVASLKRYRD